MTEDKDIELQLNEYMESLKEIAKPAFNEDEIYSKVEKAKRKRKRVQRLKIGGLTAAVLLLGLMLLANLSASFTKVTANVPVLSELVELMKITKDDKGLQEAIQNGYVQQVHVKDTKDGVTFEISNIVIDHSRLVVFYNISTHDERTIGDGPHNLDVVNADGERLESTFGSDFHQLKEKTHGSGKLDFTLNEGVPITDLIKFSAIIPIHKNTNVKMLSFNMDIPINTKMINDKKVYPLDRWMTLDGQRIYFKDAIIYPTQTVVHVRFDKHNTKKILQLVGIHIEDQNGKNFAKDMMTIGDSERTYYLTNLHYAQPKQPVLVIDRVMAVDKEEANVQVSLHDQKMIRGPKRIELNSVEETNGGCILRFFMKQPEDFQSFIFGGNIRDNAGKDIDTIERTKSWHERMIDETVEITKGKYQDPISFELSGYPSYLKGDIRIPLKK